MTALLLLRKFVLRLRARRAIRLRYSKIPLHGPDTDRTRTKSAHVVGYELNSTTRTRPDPHGPNGVSPQKKSVRVRVRVRVVEFSSSPTMCADFVRVGSGPCRVRVVEFSY